VLDAKTGEDITRSILLQIILEEEAAGVPLFTTDLLAQMIRFYGHAMQGMLGKYLETNIKSFVDFQKKLQDQSQQLYGESSSQMQNDMWSQFMNFQGPAMQTMMATYMEQSKKMLHQMQDQLKTQTRTLFTSIPLPGFPVDAGKQTKDAEIGAGSAKCQAQSCTVGSAASARLGDLQSQAFRKTDTGNLSGCRLAQQASRRCSALATPLQP
jgi:hypothetical protein